MTRRAAALLAFVLSFGAACAHQQPGQLADTSSTGIDRTVLTFNEISEKGLQGSTVYEVIRQLRPWFFNNPSGARNTNHPISVSINGGDMRPMSILQSTQAQSVREIRFLTTSEAFARFSFRAPGPVILLTLPTQ